MTLLAEKKTYLDVWYFSPSQYLENLSLKTMLQEANTRKSFEIGITYLLTLNQN